MDTITIQIGNSDNKLSQMEWSAFIKDVVEVVESLASVVHFYGTSLGDAPWQNAAWVVVFTKENQLL